MAAQLIRTAFHSVNYFTPVDRSLNYLSEHGR
jgi:hypothetical protein